MGSMTQELVSVYETLLDVQKRLEHLDGMLQAYRPEVKWCPQCRRYLELGMFYKNKTRSDGRCGICKECDNRSRMARGYNR